MDTEQKIKVKALTKRELIEELESLRCDDDTPVFFSYNYGDHWRTEVAEGIEEVEESEIAWSDYHRMYKVPDEEYRDSYDEKGELRSVIVIKG